MHGAVQPVISTVNTVGKAKDFIGKTATKTGNLVDGIVDMVNGLIGEGVATQEQAVQALGDIGTAVEIAATKGVDVAKTVATNIKNNPGIGENAQVVEKSIEAAVKDTGKVGKEVAKDAATADALQMAPKTGKRPAPWKGLTGEPYVRANLGVDYPADILEEALAKAVQNNAELLSQETRIIESIVKETAGTIIKERGAPWKATDFISDFKRQKHFYDHVIRDADWGPGCTMTIEEYVQKARDLLNSPVEGNIEGFVNKNGFVFRYNKATNEFATGKPNGVIETFYKPTDGSAYWEGEILGHKLTI